MCYGYSSVLWHLENFIVYQPLGYWDVPTNSWCTIWGSLSCWGITSEPSASIVTWQEQRMIGLDFLFQGLWDVEQEGHEANGCSILRVYVHVAFSKKTMWKGISLINCISVSLWVWKLCCAYFQLVQIIHDRLESWFSANGHYWSFSIK